MRRLYWWAVLCCLPFFNKPQTTHELIPIHVTHKIYVLVPSSIKEIELQAKLISSEARGEPFSGKLAVGEVAVNRIDTTTLADVIYSQSQFNGVNSPNFALNPDIECYLASILSLSGSHMLSDSVKYFVNRTIATDTLWLLERKEIGSIGNHTFYQ